MASATEIAQCTINVIRHINRYNKSMLLPEKENDAVIIVKALGNHISDDDAIRILNGIRAIC